MTTLDMRLSTPCLTTVQQVIKRKILTQDKTLQNHLPQIAVGTTNISRGILQNNLNNFLYKLNYCLDKINIRNVCLGGSLSLV